MALSLQPQEINKDCWYYEERKGLCVVRGSKSVDMIYIPWDMIRTSLARKDKKRLPCTPKAKESRPTVRPKRAVQQRHAAGAKAKPCPKCKGEGWVRCRDNGNYSENCSVCGGSGTASA